MARGPCRPPGGPAPPVSVPIQSKEAPMTINFTTPEPQNHLKPRITVIGVGGAGGRITTSFACAEDSSSWRVRAADAGE